MVFVGLENYRWLFDSSEFYNALWKTITIGVLATVPQLMLALGLAHLLNYNMAVRNFFRVSMLMPYATSVAASTLVFAQLFGRDAGLINWVLSLVGVDAVDWRNGNWTAQLAIALIVTWRWTGYNALIFLAAMQAVPRDLYEAAVLDGASRVRQFFSVTVPMLRPTIIFVVITATIGGLQVFDEPRTFDQLGQGGADRQWMTVTMYLYELGWGAQKSFGKAAAVAWLLFLIIVVIGMVNFALIRRISSSDSTRGGSS